MSEDFGFLAAFAHDWDHRTLDERIAALVQSVVRAGWIAASVEIATPGASVRSDVGAIPLPDGDAGSRRLLIASLPRFAAHGAFVIPEADRAGVAPLVLEGPGDLVIVPLVARDEQIGTIVAVGAAREEAVRALRALGDVTAIAIDAENRLRRAEGDAERAAVIARVGESIRSSLDREEILRAVARDVRVAFASTRCAIYVRDERNPNLARVIAADDPDIIRAQAPDRVAIVGTLLNTCLRLGQVVRIERSATAAEQAQLIPFAAESMLIVPFVVGGKIDAGLSVQYVDEHVFDDRDLQLMRTIAMHVGLALANSRLFERERSARRRAEDIERNVRALKETRTVVEILQMLLEMIAREYELAGSAWSIEGGRLLCRVVTARTGSVGLTVGDAADDALALVEMLRDHDLIPIAARSDGAWSGIVGERGGFALPLRLDARLMGMLVFDGAPRDVGDEDEREAFMRTVAAHGALALANAHAFEAERRFAQESAMISDAGRAILAHNDIDALAGAMCRVALDLAAADAACLYVPRDGSLRRVGCVSLDGTSPVPLALAFDDPLVREAFTRGDSTGGTVVGIDHTIVVPLRAAGGSQAVGVYVCVRSGRQAVPFDRGTIRLLETLGALVALGLRNVDLYRALGENNEFKDDLLAMFTHDFKGPLTVIQGYTELLLEEDLGSLRSSIETIHGQSLRLAKLAEDALVLARTQAAGFSLQRQVSDLNVFVAESVDMHDPADVRIAFTCPEPETRVSIDRTRLRHVVDNLLSNALKYSTEPVIVDVFTREGEAIMRITDRGIGIPEADLERIFVRFGRGTNARARGIAGTGVGLYVARKIVDVHGGRIGVTSRENEGSTFEVVLPLAALPAAASLVER